MDIAARKQAKAALQENEKRYRFLHENVIDFIWSTDLDLKFTYVSPSSKLMVGYSPEEVMAMNLEQLLTSASLELAKKTLAEELSLEQQGEDPQRLLTLELEHIGKDGSLIWTEAKATFLRDSQGRPVGIQGVSRDISARKRSEEARREHLYFLQTLIDTIASPIFYKNVEGIYLGCNKALADFLGLPKEEIIGKSVYEVYSKDLADKYSEMDAALFRQHGVQIYDFSMDRADGTRRDINFHKATYSTADGTLAGLVGVMMDITERKQAEEALRAASLNWQTTFDAITDGVCLLDKENRIAQANPGFLDFVGKPASEVVGRYCWEVVHGTQGPIAECPMVRMSENRRRETLELAVADRWLYVSVDPMLNEAGDLTGAVQILADITERKRVEEALRESEERFRIAAETSNDLIYEWDLKQNLQWSDRIDEMLGYGPAEFQRTLDAWLESVHPEDIDHVKASIKAHLEGRVPYVEEYRIRRKDGVYRWWSARGDISMSPDGTPVRWIGTVTDITFRKQAEEALRESEAQYRLLAENVIDVIWTMDLNWNITYATPSCEGLCGYKDKELVGMTLDQLLTSDSMDLCKKTLAELLSPENLARQEYPTFFLPQLELRFKDGSRIVYIEVKGSFLKDSQGQPGGIVGVTRDITERKQLEEQFLQAQKMEAVGTLAGGIAHDFNNILTAILGNIGLAALDNKIGPRVQDRLAQAEAACLRAQALSQQLLTFAKGGAPVKKLFSVAELLTESIPFTCVGSPVKGETTFPENLWWIEADPGQIGQAFQNLTINAIQAMPIGGTIKVWAENLTLGTASGLPLSAGRYIKISVRDQGMGIPAEHLPRIFDPYFTTKQKGSGLGLASAYAIIKKHHGHIAVESKPGVETTFHIYLPAVDQQVTPQPEEDRELLVGTGKILVMDDEEMVREVLGGMLSRLGYEVDFASDGSQAIEKYVKAKETNQPFDAVILDLTIPGGMGGKKAIKELLKIDPQAKAIVSSGYSDDPIMADFQKYWFSGVIAKPYKIAELGKVLNKVLLEWEQSKFVS